jgi:hypothetical protein
VFVFNNCYLSYKDKAKKTIYQTFDIKSMIDIKKIKELVENFDITEIRVSTMKDGQKSVDFSLIVMYENWQQIKLIKDITFEEYIADKLNELYK